jgi:hypothetical protein
MGWFSDLWKKYSGKEQPMGGEREDYVEGGGAPKKGGTLGGDEGKGGATIIQVPPGAPQPAPAVDPTQPPAAAAPAAPAAATQARQALRFHENKGEVHFHDDRAALKAAIPVAEWFLIMRKIRSLETAVWVDPQFNTIITFTPYRDGDYVECYTKLEPCRVSQTITKLSEFTKR